MEIKLINLTKGEKKIMENKPSMSRVERLHREKVTRYSIRKYSFGAASVAVAALFMFLGNGAVSRPNLKATFQKLKQNFLTVLTITKRKKVLQY